MNHQNAEVVQSLQAAGATDENTDDQNEGLMTGRFTSPEKALI